MSAPRLGFGTSGLLRVGGTRERQNILACALATGITHFDTAPIYGLGESERALGRFLKGRRQQLTVTTKFGLRVSATTARLAPAQRAARLLLRALPKLRGPVARHAGALYARPDFTPTAVRASVERSLRALSTDHVDFLLAHECSPDVAPDELHELLEELRRSGKIRDYGIASSFEHTRAVLLRRPELARVVQFESDIFQTNTTRLPTGAAKLVITHGALSRALPRMQDLLHRQPLLAKSWSAEIGIDLLGRGTAGEVLLRAALLANTAGIVLVQSASPEHIRRNACAAGDASRDEAVRRLGALVNGGLGHDC